MSDETWKKVDGYDRYEVSDRGRVKNVRWDKVPAGTSARGYRQVRLRGTDGTVKCRYVHRLVCRAFHGEPPAGYVVNHKNARKDDNTPGNLEWCTRAENNRHASRLGLMTGPRGERNRKAKLTAEAVGEIRRQSRAGVPHVELAGRYGVSGPTVSSVVHGRTWKHIAETTPEKGSGAVARVTGRQDDY